MCIRDSLSREFDGRANPRRKNLLRKIRK